MFQIPRFRLEKMFRISHPTRWSHLNALLNLCEEIKETFYLYKLECFFSFLVLMLCILNHRQLIGWNTLSGKEQENKLALEMQTTSSIVWPKILQKFYFRQHRGMCA